MNGKLNKDVLAKVQRRFNYPQENAAKVALKKQKNLVNLHQEVQAIKAIIKKKGFKPDKLKVAQLKAFCCWKKQPGDRPLSKKKADLIQRFNKTKRNASPHVSPASSEVKEMDDDDVLSMDSDASAPKNDNLLLKNHGNDESMSDGNGDESESSDAEDE